jgi:hypothetical protein
LATGKPTKKKKVKMSPNSTFANIWNIKATQLQAQLWIITLLESPSLKTPLTKSPPRL